MARRPMPSYFYVITVVKHEDRYLLVRERKHGQLWYLPAGGVEQGETLVNAVVRETREEAGVLVKPTGILRVEHTFGGEGDRAYTWWRHAFVSVPVGSTEPKTTPDEHSLEARWVPLEELPNYDLRGPDVLDLVWLVESGAVALPIDRYLGQPDFR